MNVRGTVFDIKRYAIHDGPGIRTTVFLKGCPLRCPWCHNPEGVAPGPQLMFWEGRCIGCRACEEACPRGAISFPGRVPVVDLALCDTCGECVRACYPHALELVGKAMTPGEVIQEIEKDMVFYGESGGGATFSGGEPMMQPEFLRELLKRCRRRGIHTAVDTSGFIDGDALSGLMDDVDLFLYDIKTMDDEVHEKLTGVSNAVILDNLRMLADGGKKAAVRFSVIPGVNDYEANIDALGTFVRSLHSDIDIHLLPYHRVGVDKSRRLAGSEEPEVFRPPSADALRSISRRLAGRGIEAKVGG
ncbi:MAG: glycyl-radical enzyme activating protein [bacterium]|jgi:pyruvate formate lyase activating enzyme